MVASGTRYCLFPVDNPHDEAHVSQHVDTAMLMLWRCLHSCNFLLVT